MLGSLLLPFLDLLGVVLQMGTHNALYKARQVGATIVQSTDNKVDALLSCPTQIDCPTFDQLKRSPLRYEDQKHLSGRSP